MDILAIILTAIGIVLMYIGSQIPQANQNYGTFIYLENELKEMNKELERKRKIRSIINKIGLSSCVAALLIQLFVQMYK